MGTAFLKVTQCSWSGKTAPTPKKGPLMPNICKTRPPLSCDPAPSCFKDGREYEKLSREKPRTINSLGQPPSTEDCSLWVGE